MYCEPPSPEELLNRRTRFAALMDARHPDWDSAIIVSRVNQYYLLGTMQDGLLILRRGGGGGYFVRRSFERARQESPYEAIFPMESYRDAAAQMGADLGNTFLETEVMPLAMLSRLQKHFKMASIASLDRVLLNVRAVKSGYELSWIARSGAAHDRLLREEAPALLREGMTEAELVAALYGRMMALGHHGLSRFSRFDTEMLVGQIGFGENSLVPTSFDGPGGNRGLCPAMPAGGSRERRLRKGDLVFIDVGFGMNGYHSDKTQVYLFGGQPDREAAAAHRLCMDIARRIADRLRPGQIPSAIYRDILSGLSTAEAEHFMGYGARRARFLGHGVGLHVDEHPVIAEGFDEPLAPGMVLALEPKKGMPGVGMVGVEDTYVVTDGGGQCLTGGGRDILIV